MPIYAEGIIWYLILLDAVIYNILCWTQGKWHDKATHWVSKYFPMKKVVGVWYLIMVLWLGSALLRMDILLFQ
jgi:hypothetical protein